jgi:hypothetical protein
VGNSVLLVWGAAFMCIDLGQNAHWLYCTAEPICDACDGHHGHLAAEPCPGRAKGLTMVASQLLILALAVPLQLSLLPLNAQKHWFTPGELRFWAVALFVLVEVVYLIVT